MIRTKTISHSERRCSLYGNFFISCLLLSLMKYGRHVKVTMENEFTTLCICFVFLCSCSSAAILRWDSSLLKSPPLPVSEITSHVKGDFLCTRPVTLLLRRAQVFEQSSLPETLCKPSWNGSTKITRKFNIFAHNL